MDSPFGGSLPPIPPGGPEGYRERIRYAEELQMAALNPVRSLPGAYPLNVTERALFSQIPAHPSYPTSSPQYHEHHEYYGQHHQTGLSLLVEPSLPPMTLAMLFSSSRRVFFHPRLFAGVPTQQLDRARLAPTSQPGGGWASLIEPSSLRRLLLAAAWLRWYRWTELTAATLNMHPEALTQRLHEQGHGVGELAREWLPSMPALIAFAPCTTVTWTPYRTRYYTRFWRLLSQLLLNVEQIETQTCYHLRRRLPAPLTPEVRRRLVQEAGIANGLAPEAAWRSYVGALMHWNNVPQAFVESRLAGDWEITEPGHLLALTNYLCADVQTGFHELALWRGDAARYYGVPASQIALWLLEPAVMLPQEP